MKYKSGYSIEFDFEYRGYTDKYYEYELSEGELADGIREYFKKYSVNLDGTNSDVISSVGSIPDAINEILYDVNDYLQALCKDDAYEQYKEEIEDLYFEEER